LTPLRNALMMQERMLYRPTKVNRFDFPPGRTVAGKYEIVSPLGSGYEGEVYAIVERTTGIRRAAKFYYRHRDPTGKNAIAYARKLDALRHCPILMVRMLLEAGADPNIREPEFGNTALRTAAAEGTLEMVKALLAAGADPLIPGRMTLNALDRARERRTPEGRMITAVMTRAIEAAEAERAAKAKRPKKRQKPMKRRPRRR
jgi:hypothetical protein